MSLIKTWLTDCVEGHTKQNCQPPKPADLPTRVLDLGHAGDSASSIRLFVPEVPTKAHYVALSHCWGTGQVLTTTRHNVSEHERLIPHDSLPKTFREAVQVTRELGIRYLWIDSLCILQDSPDDWDAEASHMSEVFSNAFATLFAAHASSGDEGLYAERSALATRPCRTNLRFTSGKSVYLAPATGRLAGAGGPLYRRAWVYQEEILSPRSIAFAADGVYWACHSVTASESNPQSYFNFTHSRAAFQHLLPNAPAFSTASAQERQEKLWDAWYSVVAYYGERLLTYPTDRLPALSALAKLLHARTHRTRYLAGLWEDDLARGLLWICRSFSTRSPPQSTLDEYVAPSWSWASVPDEFIGYAWMTSRTRLSLSLPWQSELTLLGVDYRLQGTNAFGRVSKATLKLEGMVADVRFSEAEVREAVDPGEVADAGSWAWILAFDAHGVQSTRQTVEVLACVRVGYRPETLCLIIEPTETGERVSQPEYRRIGVARVHSQILEERATVRQLCLI